MSRSSWTVYKKVTGSWIADGTIYRPNEKLSLTKVSTQVKTKLANGDNAFVTPSTKYLNEPMSFVWYYDDGTTKSKIEGYVENQTDLKIVDHNSVEYKGRFINAEVSWNEGEADYPYDITAIFERMSSL